MEDKNQDIKGDNDSELSESELENIPNYRPIELTKVNPKAVDINNLFGYINPLTNEWHDGVISATIR